MSVKAKYQDVLDLAEGLGVKDGKVAVEDGILKVKGMAATHYEKNIIWDKIKEISNGDLSDIKANITVEDETVYHRHTVKSGESLSLIAKHYYGDLMKYKEIFAANTDLLKSPDVIHPDQVLVIPNL